MSEATQTTEQPESTTQPESTPVEEVRNPEAVLAKNRELIGVQKELKAKLQAFEAEKKAAEEAKMAEEGNFKELIAQKDAELESLKGIEVERDSYRVYFEEKLGKAKEGLSDIQLKAVEGFNGTLAEKVKMAEEFRGDVKPPSSSPASGRPSSGITTDFDINDYLGRDGQRKLTALYHEDREKYHEVLKAKRRQS